MSDSIIAITGIGITSAFGSGLSSFLSAVESGHSAHSELTLFEVREGFEYAAEIEDLNYQDVIFSTQPYLDRTTAAALIASREALDSSGLNPRLNDSLAVNAGIVYASCWGAVDSMEKFSAPVNAGKPRSAQGLVFIQSFINSAASVIAMEYNLQGFSTVSTGHENCAFHAFESAFSALKSGKAEVMLAGAADTISELTFNHLINKNYFNADDMCKGKHFPGEASAFVVLERLEHAKKRGAEIYFSAAEIADFEMFKKDTEMRKDLIRLHGDCFSVNPFLAAAVEICGK